MFGWLVVNGFIVSEKFNNIYDYLKKAAQKLNVRLALKTTCELAGTVGERFKDLNLPDFVLFWDKDAYLAKSLEESGVKVYNNAEAIEACDNKILTALALNGKVKTPRTIIAPKTFEGINYSDRSFVQSAMQTLGSPMIIKEACGSFGQQVYLAHDLQQANEIIDSLGCKEFLMQELVKTSIGKDIRVNVVGDKVISAMLRYNEHDFRSNISNGGSMLPYETDPTIDAIAVSACRALSLDFAGVDVLFGDNGEYEICEVNSNPHFKSSFDCTGVDMSLAIMEYVKQKSQ